jgi:hypothetical protein
VFKMYLRIYQLFILTLYSGSTLQVALELVLTPFSSICSKDIFCLVKMNISKCSKLRTMEF